MSTDTDRMRLKLKQRQLQLRQAQRENSVLETVADPFRGINKGIALGLGFPVDMMNTAAGLVGGDVEEPVLGSRWIMRQMHKIGVGTEPATERGRFMHRVGESVGAAGVPLGAVGAAGRAMRTVPATLSASGPVSAAGREIVRGFQQAPRAFAATELGLGAAGGTGAAIAQEAFPGSPVAEVAGEVVGGLTPGAIARAPGLSSIRSLRNQVKPLFSERGQMQMAGEALENVAESPGRVRDIVRARSRFPEDVDLTVAQETADRGLLTLERAAVNASAKNERLYADMADTSRRAMEQAMEELVGPGQPMAPRELLNAQVNRLDELLDARIAAAQQAARNSIDDMGGMDVVSRQRVNTIVRERLEEALADARIQESELWNAVPGDAIVPTQSSREGYRRLIAGRAETADPGDIPDFVHQWLRPEKGKTKIGESNTVDNVRTLRSRILGEIRAERAKKGAANRTKIGLLQQLQGDILDDLGALPDNSLQRAREYSEQLNSKFFNKPLGRILGHERAGGVEVAPELTLERTISRRGPDAGVNADAMLRAANNSPEMREAIGTHIQQRFLQETSEQGALVPRRAEAFLNNNAELLQRFPEVRQRLENALLTQGRVADITAATKLERAVLHDKNRTISAMYLGAKPSREINAVLEASPNKVEALKELWKRMQRDPAGEAGLKAAFVREMFGRAQMAKLDADGVHGIDPKKLRRDFKVDAKAAQEAGWFTAEEMKRLDDIIVVLQRLENNFAKGRTLQEIVDLPFGAGVVDLGVRLLAAPLGSRSPLSTMGSSIVTANAAVRAARRLTAQMPTEKVRTMVAEAVFDRKLYNDLVKAARSPEDAAVVGRRLNAWLINLGVDREEEQ